MFNGSGLWVENCTWQIQLYGLHGQQYCDHKNQVTANSNFNEEKFDN